MVSFLPGLQLGWTGVVAAGDGRPHRVFLFIVQTLIDLRISSAIAILFTHKTIQTNGERYEKYKATQDCIIELAGCCAT